MTEEQKICFIIMPMSVDVGSENLYRDSEKHFQHVMDCLLVPAVVKAGYKPITPEAKGSDVIHASIIENLEKSDLVLCDISGLNPNVFFEFGIRTSLNKPVCVVKDELTVEIPFDTGIINYQEYQSTLETWEIDHEIAKLSHHIEESVSRSKGENTLWRYFGFKSTAVPQDGITNGDRQLEYLSMQIDTLKGLIESSTDISSRKPSRLQPIAQALDISMERLCGVVMGDIRKKLPRDVNVLGGNFYENDTKVIAVLSKHPGITTLNEIRTYLKKEFDLKFDCVIVQPEPSDSVS